MQRISLEAKPDHILGLTRFRTPIVAIEELIWNALDANATKVQVKTTMNNLCGLERIEVSDNGDGLPMGECQRAFGSIGGSPKADMGQTSTGRRPHGKSGRGRLKAFGIGNKVRWVSRYKDGDKIREYAITGLRSGIDSFEIGDICDSTKKHSGVSVEISLIENSFPSLLDYDDAATQLAQRLALYLNQYPGISIFYNQNVVDGTTGQVHSADYPIEIETSGGEKHKGTLKIIEWQRPTTRVLYLCDSNGFARDERQPGIQAKGENFTAYFKSDLIEKLDEEDALAFEDLHPTVKSIVDACKDSLKQHFRARRAVKAVELLKQWEEQGIYPYQRPPKDPIETAEREVFDVCALSVNEFLPSFENSERPNKKLTFQLIKQALESNATALQRILSEVLSLPKDKQEEFAQLLGKTKLAAIISAAKIVVDRLDFLGCLDGLLFGTYQKTLNEPRQLHQILANELWLFGEEYQLGADEKSLKNVLKKHIALLGREELVTDVESVTDLDGRERFLDLLLYRRYPQRSQGNFEHLVIELKRPSIKLGSKEITQIKDYAYKVAADQRFDKDRTQWTFILIGNELNDFAKNDCEATGREYGHIAAGRVNIYVRTWADIIAQAQWRYEFFREKLEYEAESGEGLGYLHERYANYFPDKTVDSKTSKKAPPKKKPAKSAKKSSPKKKSTKGAGNKAG